jgi:hypothetical protein
MVRSNLVPSRHLCVCNETCKKIGKRVHRQFVLFLVNLSPDSKGLTIVISSVLQSKAL